MNDIQTILGEMKQVLEQVDPQIISQVTEKLQFANRIFVAGEGRSGFMAKSFAMRLMHLGAHVYVVGETITPSLQKGDILVAVSGSGTTKNVVNTAKIAKELDCEVVSITTSTDSSLAEQSTLIAHIPAATKFRREKETASIQPLGSLFDQCVHVFCDAVCLSFATKQAEDNDTAFMRHSNLE